jgi:broad specificity phosphatase PhoE
MLSNTEFFNTTVKEQPFTGRHLSNRNGLRIQLMPTRIYLVRHGATALTEEDRFAGASEVPDLREIDYGRWEGLTILDFATGVRARLRVFNDVSHYEGMPARRFERRLSRWWVKPD